jgi:hypothetical protein
MVPDPAKPDEDGMHVYCLLPGYFNAADAEALEQLVQDYCKTHGKLREYVEDPIIHVFASLMNINIVVYHTTVEDPININIDAGLDDSSVMTLWCNGGHYMVRYRPLNPKPYSLNPPQALIDKTRVTISDQGLKSLETNNWVKSNQVTLASV